MEEEEFRVRFSLDDSEFNAKVSKIDSKMHAMEDKDRVIPFRADTSKFTADAQAALKKFEAMTKSMSKVSAMKYVLGDPSKNYAYARVFNKIEEAAIDMYSTLGQQKEAITLEINVNDEKLNAVNTELNQTESELNDLQSQMKQFSWMDMSTDEIINELNNLQQARQKLIGQRLTPIRLGDTEEVTRLTTEIDAITEKMQIYRQQLSTGNITTDSERKEYEALKVKIEETTKKLEELKNMANSLGANNSDLTNELSAVDAKIEGITADLNRNVLTEQMHTTELKHQQSALKAIQNRYNGVNKEARKMNIFARIGSSMLTRMRFQIVSWLNPFNVFKKAWNSWIDTNTKMKNTFTNIGQNLTKVIAPILEKIAMKVLELVKYVNIFTKAWMGIDLFAKTEKSAKKTKKTIDSMTASFDELHTYSSSDSDDEDDEAFSDIDIPVNEGIFNALTAAANNPKLKKIAEGIGKAIGWAIEHPIQAIALGLGAKFVAGLVGKGIGKLIGAGFKKLFGGSAATEAATSGGSLLGGLFGKTLYTGMGGKAVTVGKLLGGVALAAGGTALAIGQAADAGAHWQDLSTGAKAAKVATVGLGSAAAGLGAVMLGASGPVGWAVAGVVALTSFCVGMAQTQDGIDSVKKETEKLQEAQENAAVAQQNYETAVSNAAVTMSNLEQIEQATGLSGAALDEQVRNGTLEVDKMTSAQLQVYSAYLQNQKAIEELKTATEQKKEADHQATLQSLKVDAANAIEAKSYDELREKVVKAWEEGSISAEEAGDILSRTLANADDETQKTFGDSIPDALKKCYEPDQYESGWRKFGNAFKNFFSGIGKWFEDKWNGIKKWWNGLWNKNDTPEPEAPSGPNGELPSYAVGTNYVPNDQVAQIHKGEAIIPAKYNKPGFIPSGTDAGLASTISSMNTEIANLRDLISRGIPVTGEFRQRGNDLVATVEKAKSRRGTQPINNPAYAR